MDFWIASNALPEATPDGFYRRVDQTLEKIGFGEEVRSICAPTYADASRGGRSGIDPVVYLKMLMVGFFEDLPSAPHGAPTRSPFGAFSAIA